MNSNSIPFNEPYMIGRELWYIAQAHTNGHLSGDGMFTKKCHAWLEARTGAQKALLIHSCTAALEMAAILADMVVHGESWQSLANSPIGWRGYRCGSD